jgi:hypothetical protein
MFGSRGETLLWASCLAATVVGVVTVLLLRAFTLISVIGVFTLSILAAFIALIGIVFALTKLGR